MDEKHREGTGQFSDWPDIFYTEFIVSNSVIVPDVEDKMTIEQIPCEVNIMVPDELWKERLKAFESRVAVLIKNEKGIFVDDDKMPYSALHSAILSLQNFVQDQFYFFWDGFVAKEFLVPSYDYPPRFILRTILDQAFADLLLFETVLFQRWSLDRERELLQQVDSWANVLLQKSNMIFQFGPPVVITCFGATPQVRVVPYASIAIIQIPTTATIDSCLSDLLVLPHEIGHHVYWHGYHEGTAIRHIVQDAFQGSLPILKGWAEEFFCDLWGLWHSGEPAILKAMTELLVDNDPARFVLGDGTYPVDGVRLRVFYRAFQQIVGKIHELAKEDAVDLSGSLGRLFEAFDQHNLPPELEHMVDQRRIIGDGQTHVVGVDHDGELTRYSIVELETELLRLAEEIARRAGVNTDVLYRDWLEGFKRFSKILDAPSTDLPQDCFELFCREVSKDFIASFSAQAKLTNYGPLDPMKSKAQTFVVLRNAMRQKKLKIADQELPVVGKFEPSDWLPIFAAGGWISSGPETLPSGGGGVEPPFSHKRDRF